MVLCGEDSELLGAAALLIEVHYRVQNLRLCNLDPLPVSSLCFLLMVKDVIRLHLALATCCHAFVSIMDSPLRTMSRKQTLLKAALGHGGSSQQI